MSIPRPTREWVEEMATYWPTNEPLGMLARAYLAQSDENEALAKALGETRRILTESTIQCKGIIYMSTVSDQL
jgi:hypothetical protein